MNKGDEVHTVCKLDAELNFFWIGSVFDSRMHHLASHGGLKTLYLPFGFIPIFTFNTTNY